MGHPEGKRIVEIFGRELVVGGGGRGEKEGFQVVLEVSETAIFGAVVGSGLLGYDCAHADWLVVVDGDVFLGRAAVLLSELSPRGLRIVDGDLEAFWEDRPVADGTPGGVDGQVGHIIVIAAESSVER